MSKVTSLGEYGERSLRYNIERAAEHLNDYQKQLVEMDEEESENIRLALLHMTIEKGKR